MKGITLNTNRSQGLSRVTLSAGIIAVTVAVFSAFVPSASLGADGVTTNEAKGMGISTQWRGSRGLVTKGADGKVIFLYGEVQPSVVCSPLQVCDIELQRLPQKELSDFSQL